MMKTAFSILAVILILIACKYKEDNSRTNNPVKVDTVSIDTTGLSERSHIPFDSLPNKVKLHHAKQISND